MKSETELLLEASLQISRLKREAALSADAIRYLRETLAERDAEIAKLRSIPFRRDMTQPMYTRNER